MNYLVTSQTLKYSKTMLCAYTCCYVWYCGAIVCAKGLPSLCISLVLGNLGLMRVRNLCPRLECAVCRGLSGTKLSAWIFTQKKLPLHKIFNKVESLVLDQPVWTALANHWQHFTHMICLPWHNKHNLCPLTVHRWFVPPDQLS